jgi:ribulose-5-phosphate 4-epimerase/fuculose-1-phosphate aldolase
VSEYVKFTSECVNTALTPFAGFAEFDAYRRKLIDLRLVGVDSNGVGFGNLSIREGMTNHFYITGSGTGGISELTLANCAKVIAYDFENNWVQYEGLTMPSSESLTHAAIYKFNTTLQAVIHCHDARLWLALLNEIPTTAKAVAYGTPEMAYEIMRLFANSDVQSRKILAMAGHEGGIVTFGRNLEEAFAILMREQESSAACTDTVFHKRTHCAEN